MNTPRHRITPTFCYALVVLTGLVMACGPTGDERPDKLIPADKMADILTEVHLAESRVSRLGLASVDSSNLVYKHLERGIYKKFGVDTSAYSNSYIYYASHPREMEGVYKRVVENLKKKTEAKKPTRS